MTSNGVPDMRVAIPISLLPLYMSQAQIAINPATVGYSDATNNNAATTLNVFRRTGSLRKRRIFAPMTAHSPVLGRFMMPNTPATMATPTQPCDFGA